MKHISILFALLLAVMPLAAQTPFDAAVNNEDEVVHLEQWQRHAAVPLQAIVKLQDYSQYTIKSPGQGPKSVNPGNGSLDYASKASGRIECPAIQAVLDSFVVERVEQLCPTFVMPREPRRSASYGGGEVRDHDLSQLYLITLSAESAHNEYELIEALAALDEVEYAEPNYRCFALGEIENSKLKIENSADATYLQSDIMSQTERKELSELSFGSFSSDCALNVADATDLQSDIMSQTERKELSELSFGSFSSDCALNVADATYTAPDRISGLRPQGGRKDAAGQPNDPMYSLQWGIPACGIDSLLTAPKRDSTWRPIIAIIDTGVDIDHPDLAENIWTNPAEEGGAAGQDDDANGFADDVHGWDFVNQTAEMHDFNSHGTHCAGIAGAVTNNGIGIAGACPDALIMPVTVMQSDGSGDIATVVRGINYAAQNGADVISMSIGTYAYSIAMEQALAVAYQTAVLVASAGNDGFAIHTMCCGGCLAPPQFPGAFTFVLGVQATQQGGRLASFSNYDCDGPSISLYYSEEQFYNYELSAPGVGIISTVPNGGYRSYNGTSMACPLVAGGIASLMQRREYLTKEILFGDLINYSQEFQPVDFWTVYNADSVAPAILQLVAMEINDTAYGDSSMYADAGERLQLYPTVRTVWGPTDSVELWLEFQEFEDTNTLQILQNHVQLGRPISAYAKAKSVNPIDIRIDSNVVDGRHIRLVLCAASRYCADTLRHSFVMNVTNGVKLHGMIVGNYTLYPNVQYIVTSNVALPSDDTLFIKPGTTLKIKDSCSINATIMAIGKPDSVITFTKTDLGQPWGSLSNMREKGCFDYCVLEYSMVGSYVIATAHSIKNTLIKNCGRGELIHRCDSIDALNIFYSDVYTGPAIQLLGYPRPKCMNANLIDNYSSAYNGMISRIFDADYDGSKLGLERNYNVYPNTYSFDGSYLNNNVFSNNTVFNYRCANYNPEVTVLDSNYHGSFKEEIIRQGVYDFNSPNYINTYGFLDLSRRQNHPSSDAHGIVWKVEVNGYDAQDEFDSIIPLGVGTHEFKVYFNRAMDTSITPMVAMGVRPPYTQTAIGENASWSDDSTIYTAYLTLTGRSAIDGLNRIYVNGAQDDEHFEIPYENQRFNVYVASSGSMSAGFQATPGIGKVDLEWNDQEVNYADFLGFNIYRYQYDSLLTNRHYESGVGYVYDTVWGPTDTIRLNQTLVQDTMFTDFDVVPGERYYYYYKILSTSLTENSPSKTVSCVPHSSIRGDANGSYAVDVADVIATIGYVTGQHPQPFLFEAADVNGDGQINVLDIVGIINIILYGDQGSKGIHDQQTAVYSVENDTLWVETPVALAGLQFTLGGCTRSQVEVLEALRPFECATVEENGNLTMLFYSMSGATVPAGKTALLRVGNGEWGVENIALSDAQGQNVVPLNGNQVGITEAVQAQFATAYPNPFCERVRLELTVGDYRTATVVFTDLTGRTVETRSLSTPTAGRYSMEWDATGCPRGIYFATLYADGQKAHTIKLVVK